MTTETDVNNSPSVSRAGVRVRFATIYGTMVAHMYLINMHGRARNHIC